MGRSIPAFAGYSRESHPVIIPPSLIRERVPPCGFAHGLLSQKGFILKNVVRLAGMGLVVLGQLACGGQVEGVEEGQQGQPVMSKLHALTPEALQARQTQKAAEAGRVHQLGPAPNLSSVQVIAVCSDDFYTAYYPYDCEDVTATSTTGFNHGGTIIVITQEMGYRVSSTTSMGGYSVPELGYQSITNWYNEIIGYYRYWEPVNGQQSGTFSYSATSINTYAVFSDSVSVL